MTNAHAQTCNLEEVGYNGNEVMVIFSTSKKQQIERKNEMSQHRKGSALSKNGTPFLHFVEEDVKADISYTSVATRLY